MAANAVAAGVVEQVACPPANDVLLRFSFTARLTYCFTVVVFQQKKQNLSHVLQEYIYYIIYHKLMMVSSND